MFSDPISVLADPTVSGFSVLFFFLHPLFKFLRIMKRSMGPEYLNYATILGFYAHTGLQTNVS